MCFTSKFVIFLKNKTSDELHIFLFFFIVTVIFIIINSLIKVVGVDSGVL